MPQNKYQKFEPKGGSTNQLTFQVVGSEWVRSRLDIILEVCNMALECRLDLSWSTLYSLCASVPLLKQSLVHILLRIKMN